MKRESKEFSLSLGQLKGTTALVKADVEGLRVEIVEVNVPMFAFTGAMTTMFLDVKERLTISALHEMKDSFREDIVVADYIEDWDGPGDVA